MNTIPTNVKNTAMTNDSAPTVIDRIAKFIVNGVAFVCILLLLIAATVLLFDRHLHVKISVDSADTATVDLKKNH